MAAIPLVTAAVAAAVTTVALAGCTSPAATGTTPTSTLATASGAVATPTPGTTTGWGLPADPSAAAKAAGLPMLGEETLTVHYHAHLDVLVDGRPVPVPAGIGIDETKRLISPLHTHDGTGVVHIESAKDVPFTLGQVFAEWGQPLTDRHVGPVTLTSGQVLRVFRNGQQASGDPAALRLGAHDEIVVWVGASDAQPKVSASYSFPPGA
jgi:hypothetical protein